MCRVPEVRPARGFFFIAYRRGLHTFFDRLLLDCCKNYIGRIKL
jgi:hypothetical protein